MKKTAYVLLVVVGMSLSLSSFAQDEPEFKSIISLNGGFSLVGALFDLPDATGTGDVSSFSAPAIQVNYDYYFSSWFTLGAAFSVQFMGIEYTDYYDDFSADTWNHKTNVTRLNIGTRALFHYANEGRMDLYSGLRLGLTNWNVSTNNASTSYDPSQDITFSEGIVFAPQLILFGAQGYFTDNIGANFELTVGAPHFFSIGLNYRF